MKLTGFALKKDKKKTFEASAGFSSSPLSAPLVTEKVYVTEFDPNAPVSGANDHSKPLVIPLLEANNWSCELNAKNDEEIANQEEAIGNFAETKVRGEVPTEVPQDLGTNGRFQKREELFQDSVKRSKDNPKKPILLQNAVPGIDKLHDVTDKYRHDVAMRPDAPAVNSNVYDSVPVEAFGVALLRGMGWKGDVDPNEVGEAPQPRHKLLGLGATKRPTLPKEDKKKKKRIDRSKTQDGDRRSVLTGSWKDDKKSCNRARSTGRGRRRTRSPTCLDRWKRSRSRSSERERDHKDRRRHRERDRDRKRRSRSASHSRSNRHSRRR
ncbi:hypothetical protein PsorP6_019100 [Peronosclerospora sorghi]|nr:hypothetical protein PsorP6_019100 [Peronosclerospora sorghi]